MAKHARRWVVEAFWRCARSNLVQISKHSWFVLTNTCTYTYSAWLPTRTQSLRRRRPRAAVLDFSCRAQGTDCNDCRLPSFGLPVPPTMWHRSSTWPDCL